MTVQRINPPELATPIGFSHAVIAEGSTIVLLAGQKLSVLWQAFWETCVDLSSAIADRLDELVGCLEFLDGEGTVGCLGGLLLVSFWGGGGLGRPHSCLSRNVPGSSVADPVKSERLESAVFAVFGQKHLALKPIHDKHPILKSSFWA